MPVNLFGERDWGERELTIGKNIAYCTPTYVLGRVGLHIGDGVGDKSASPLSVQTSCCNMSFDHTVELCPVDCVPNMERKRNKSVDHIVG